MKSLLSILIVFTIVAPLSAEMVVFSEDYESGTVTNPLVDGVSGWTGSVYTKYSDVLVDSGNSASYGSYGWQWNYKAFSHSPVAGEVYTFSATVLAPGTVYPANDASYVVVGIDKADGSARGLNACDIDVGAGGMTFAVPGASYTVTQPTVATDVKMVLSADAVDCYYRTHGDIDWNYVGSGAGVTLSDYNEVKTCLLGYGSGSISNVDSILLSSVPEPSTAALIAIGMIGLTLVWRKRK